MSNPTTVTARSVPFAVSTDGNTYKNLVCKKVWNIRSETPVTQEESDCSVHSSVGTNRWSFEFEIVVNTTPNGSTEISADTVLGYHINGTLIYVKLTSGSSYYRQGQGYISAYSESAPQGGFVTATGTFTGDGTLDISA